MHARMLSVYVFLAELSTVATGKVLLPRLTAHRGAGDTKQEKGGLVVVRALTAPVWLGLTLQTPGPASASSHTAKYPWP